MSQDLGMTLKIHEFALACNIGKSILQISKDRYYCEFNIGHNTYGFLKSPFNVLR